ncbi:DUF4232 domain-containing protein [Streptomyces termitum]|uniref:DUF4232 domain-containing protein n=1 Tax=Streptomyces termitum TaxID=67368 RepID=UPI0037B79137
MRIRRRATVLAATAALALSLTACQDDLAAQPGTRQSSQAKPAGGAQGGQESAPAASGGDSASAGTQDSGSTPKGSGSGSGAKGSGSAGSGDAAGSNSSAEPCKGEELSIGVEYVRPEQEGQRLSISARNADSKPCWVVSYPSVMLGDSTTVLGHSGQDTASGTKRIVLQPRSTAYAEVFLVPGESKAEEQSSSDLSIALRDQTGDTGPGMENGATTADGAVAVFRWKTAEVTNWHTRKLS